MDVAARALGTSNEAMRIVFDAMRATSERYWEDSTSEEESTCETRRLCAFLLTLRYTAAGGQSTSVLRDDGAFGAFEETSASAESSGSESGGKAAPMSPPSRSPSKWAALRRGREGSGHGEGGGDAFGAWSSEGDDDAFGTFLFQNWDAVARGCQLTKEGSSTLTRDEVECLDFLFEVRDERGERSTLAKCALGNDREIDVTHLREWVARHMDPLHAAATSTSASAGAVSNVSTVAAIAEMAVAVDESTLKTVVTVDGAHKTTVVRRQGDESTRAASGSAASCRTSPRDLPTFGSPGYIAGATPTATITDCTDSIIYLLEPYHYLNISGCVDCTIIVGVVARSARVERCERVTLICAAKRVAVRSCFDCTFHLGITRQPVFVGHNRKCVLAPYNTFYEHLCEHLAEARLVPDECTAWDRPAVLGTDVTIKDSSTSPRAPDVVRISSGVALMPPDAFSLFIIPFRKFSPEDVDVGADTTPPTPSSVAPITQANPFNTPASYVNALDAKMQRIRDVRTLVRDAPLADVTRAELQGAIQSHFKSWLQQSGKSREVFDLSAIDRDELLGSTSRRHTV